MSVTFILFLLYLLIFIIGTMAGSFINTLTCRMAMKLPVFRGRAFCPNCGRPLAFYDMVPLISYLWLGRRCRKCKAPIALRYFLTELAGGLIAVLSIVRFGFNLSAAVAFLAGMILLAQGLAAHDSRTTSLKLTAALVIPAGLCVVAFLTPVLTERLIGGVAAGFFFFLLSFSPYVDKKDSLLMAVCGFMLGWKASLIAVIIAAVLAVGVIVLRILRKEADKPVAFSPCLCAGVFTALYFGGFLLDWYWALL